jgi:hypothetical protein
MKKLFALLALSGSIAVFVGNWAVEKGPPPRLRRV